MDILDAHTVFGSVPYQSADLSLATLVALMRKHSIGRALSLSLKGVHYDFALGNDETRQAAREHPEIIPVATVDPRRHLGCAEELGLRARQGFRAFRVFPEQQGWPLDFLPFLQLLPELEAAGLPLLINCSAIGTATKVVRALDGFKLNVILLGISYDTLAEAIAAAKVSSHIYIETHRLAAPDAFRLLASEAGIERMVFGSCAPVCYPGSALMAVEKAGLTAAEKEMVLGKNLARLLDRGAG
jgi:predicted TIM-barrel fold metal-dependent hydrolase